MGVTNTKPEEHVLVCISSSPNNARVIEAGAVLSRAFDAKFTALSVEQPTKSALRAEQARQLENNLGAAEKAGAQIAISYGADIPLQIAEFAKTARVTKIVLGRAAMGGLFRQRRDTVARLAKLLPRTELFLVPEEADKRAHAPVAQLRSFTLRSFAIEFAILTVTTLVGLLLRTLGFSEASIMTLYILAVLLTAFVGLGVTVSIPLVT